MPSAARYVLKDSHPAILQWARETKDPNVSNIEDSYELQDQEVAQEILYGLQMAMLSITDDKKGTLKKVGKMNPWQVQSIKLLCGAQDCHKPLTELLKNHFGLLLDCHIDESGVTKGGHALDTQGFIAHNDKNIVLAYRCHSGLWSCWDVCNRAKANLPLVHTGFYNNFLCTIESIHYYIDPLVKDGSSRTLYIAGHSLGAGIATIAACYFLLNPDYANVPIRIVTAGGPRAVTASMQRAVERALLTTHTNAKFYRTVRDKDGVPKVPPAFLGFRHLGTTVFITKPDAKTSNDKKNRTHLIVNPNLVVPKKTFTDLVAANADLKAIHDQDGDDSEDSDSNAEDEDAIVKVAAARVLSEEITDDHVAYNKKIAMIPRSLRDHMPEFYTLPLYQVTQTTPKFEPKV